MLQKWKRKGKRFRHVEKDGEETTDCNGFMYYICTKSEIGCTLDEKQMEMQTLNKKADATREKDIYRVTVVGSVVNFLLLVFLFSQ